MQKRFMVIAWYENKFCTFFGPFNKRKKAQKFIQNRDAKIEGKEFEGMAVIGPIFMQEDW